MIATSIINAIGFSIILTTIIGTISCSRPPKFVSRPKNNCLKNISNTYDQNQDINRSPKCIALNNPYYCLDIKLPYYLTTLPEYVPDLNLKSIDEVQSYLQRWQGARKLPKCWPILQVALCSILMPRCEEDSSTGKALRTHIPNVDICKDLVARDECNFIERHLGDWPAIFNCNDTSLYAKNCRNDLRDLSFSSSQSTCQYPLVKSNDESNWFKDIGGCALHCLISSLFALIFFLTNGASGKISRMAKIVRICNLCQIFVYIGWYLQFLTNSDIGCDSHGSILYGLPLVANACVLSFILTYIPGLTCLFWCTYLGKTYHEELLNQAKKKDNSDLNGTIAILNYGIPLILFIFVAFLGHIDGKGLYGICTVGQRSILIKSTFVFAPTIIGTLYGNYYFIQIAHKLAFINSEDQSVRRNLIRITLLVVTSIMQVVLSIGNYFYELTNRDNWRESIDRYTACSLNLSDISSAEGPPIECNIDTKPVVQLYYLEILSNLTMGIVIASWAFHRSNYRRFLLRLMDLLEDKRDKQRRQANNRLDSLDSVGMGPTVASRLLDTNLHDIIDMPSEEENRMTIEMGTTSSLASTNLALDCQGTETDSYVQSNYTHRNTYRERTLRDVVNDVRHRFQQHQAIINNQPSSITKEQLEFIIMMMIATRTFNPLDLVHPDNKPKFEHEFSAG